jgi:predicted NAD-dependent protein-ADP-ribosyltransferase YbiA (DUF1768 family)
MNEQANSSEVKRITSFAGHYRFLSNNYPIPVAFEKSTYWSVTNAYEASKFPIDSPKREEIRNATAIAAVRLGKSSVCDPFQEQDRKKNNKKLLEFLRIKFRPGSYLARKLVETYPLVIIKTGFDTDTGVLLMRVREELMNNLT